MNTPHKHADIIHAWADGAKIQYLAQDGLTWIDTDRPGWCERDTYRIKLSVEIPEGFTPFEGGECPVDPSCIVEILLRNGETNKNNFGYSADLFRWDHTGVEHDIIAYKVIKNAPVVRWQWIYRCFGKLIMTERFYASEEEFREHNRATEIELLKKADWTRTEFDE
jgi:hypothetical protein